MKRWTVKLTRKSYKQLKKLPMVIQSIVDEAIYELEKQGPAPKYWDVKKTGTEEYRIRLNYRYRMRYSTQDTNLLIEIFYIGHRKDAY